MHSERARAQAAAQVKKERTFLPTGVAAAMADAFLALCNARNIYRRNLPCTASHMSPTKHGGRERERLVNIAGAEQAPALRKSSALNGKHTLGESLVICRRRERVKELAVLEVLGDDEEIFIVGEEVNEAEDVPVAGRVEALKDSNLIHRILLYAVPVYRAVPANALLQQLLDGDEAERRGPRAKAHAAAALHVPLAHDGELHFSLEGLAEDAYKLVASRAVDGDDAVRHSAGCSGAVLKTEKPRRGIRITFSQSRG